MNKTDIEWTTFTSNALKYRRKSDGKVVWACVKTSPGCAHCYSEKIALRFERGKLFNAHNMEQLEPFLDEKELHAMLTKKIIAGIPVSGSRCFVGDMTDMFGEWVSDALLDRLFAVMAQRSDVTFQVLTKRAERMAGYLAKRRWEIAQRAAPRPDTMPWPLPNVWLGVSVEDQQRADERIPLLLRTPAAVRFLSCEPLLGPINLRCASRLKMRNEATQPRWIERLDWVIVGGESGPNARPMHPDWARSLRDQCHNADVPFFFKQWGEYAPRAAAINQPADWDGMSLQRVGKKAAGRLLDGREHNDFPATAKTVQP